LYRQQPPKLRPEFRIAASWANASYCQLEGNPEKMAELAENRL